jgi:hypothetical protein
VDFREEVKVRGMWWPGNPPPLPTTPANRKYCIQLSHSMHTIGGSTTALVPTFPPTVQMPISTG